MIDCNTFIGHWPFRRLRRNTPEAVVGMLDEFGVVQACAASIDAILYRNVHAGNEALFEQTGAVRERFVLQATLNPTYAGWQRQLRWCIDHGFGGIRVYSLYHDYALDSKEAAALFDAAAEAGLTVSLFCRMEDSRQRHRLDIPHDLDPEAALAAAERHPRTDFLLLESYITWRPGDARWKRLRATRLHIEHSRYTSLMARPLEVMIREAGPERVLFGTGFPVKSPSPAFLKIQALDAPDETKKWITGGNARRLFPCARM